MAECFLNEVLVGIYFRLLLQLLCYVGLSITGSR